jgi:hypothetical protein
MPMDRKVPTSCVRLLPMDSAQEYHFGNWSPRARWALASAVDAIGLIASSALVAVQNFDRTVAAKDEFWKLPICTVADGARYSIKGRSRGRMLVCPKGVIGQSKGEQS